MRDEITGGQGKLHNEELHNLYSQNIIEQIKDDEMDSACSMHGREEWCIKVLVWKSLRKETTRKI
jgi:hypothetical protein